jgi:tetratricopeptide (TPR) repeat protein
VRLKRSAEGIADLEKLLASLNPTSWLHRDVRRRIEQVFLRTDDQDGLAKYYETWIEKNPEDVDAMARLARILARQARVPEAQRWLDQALKLAPSRKELRLAFIQQLVDDQRYAEAIAQYAVLDKNEPNHPDYLREWGKLILRDTSRPKEERLKAAETVWLRLVAARDKDPLIATQVADLLRHAEATDAALALYRKAVELAPTQPQYREYLGEYYHQLKRPEEALATWREIAAGKNRTAANLARLAEVLASFGYVAQSLPEIQAAVKLDPKDFALAMKGALLHAQGEKYEQALAYLTTAQSLAQNEEEREAILQEQIKVYQLEGTLEKRTAELAAAVAKGEPTFRQLYLLARYQQSQRQTTEATQSIEAALKLQPQSIPALAAAARIHEEAGELQRAADLNRSLATIDRRARGDYLRRIAQLESQLGRIQQAIQAGRDLVASAPGNTEHYDFLADLCFRLGEPEEGLQALRRAMRINPSDPKTAMALADALAAQFRTDEAIELYWNAWDKATDLEARLGIVSKQAEFYLQTNHFDRLLERLERLRQDADDKREATICLAQAFHAAGDFGMSRQELESLLTQNTRDTQLLQQLSKLAETEGDLPAAVKYQEQLVQLAPGPETEYRLATLLSANGQGEESAAIIVRLTTREEDPEKLLRNIDSLLAAGQYETALLITEAKLREAPQDWELIYREGIALAKQNKNADAEQRFKAIVARRTAGRRKPRAQRAPAAEVPPCKCGALRGSTRPTRFAPPSGCCRRTITSRPAWGSGRRGRSRRLAWRAWAGYISSRKRQRIRTP